MDIDRKVLSRIKETLKNNPRGMNVLEIAREIKMHRQSVAKYLEMLVVSGLVDVKKFGPSRVFYLSERLPISAMLSLSRDLILVLDKNFMIVNVNDAFLKFYKVEREDVMYKKIEQFSFPLEFTPSFLPDIKNALDGKESAKEASYKKYGKTFFFIVSFIPLVFDDGQKGVTILFTDITDRKKMEDALRESEENFRVLVETSIAGMAIYQGEHIVNANKAFEQITGYSKDELLAMKFWKIAHPDYQELIKQRGLSRQQNKQVPSCYEVRLRTKNGETRCVELNAAYILYKGKPAGMVTLYDITNRKKAEHELKKSEARLARAQQIAHVGSYDMDIVNNKIHLSDECHKMLGLKTGEKEPTFDDLIAIVHPDDRESLIKSYNDAIGGIRPMNSDHRILLGDGSIRFIHNEGEITYDDSGKPVNLIGITMDITGRRLAEDRISYLTSFLMLMQGAVIEVGPDLRISFTNPAADRMFPDLRLKGISHPMLSVLDEIKGNIEDYGKAPLMRNVDVGNSSYKELVQYLPDYKIIRIYAIDVARLGQADGIRVK